MHTSTAGPHHGAWPARVIIIDDHDISRAACTALLRAEGIDVTDFRASDQALTVTRALRADVAIIDVAPAADTGFDIILPLRWSCRARLGFRR